MRADRGRGGGALALRGAALLVLVASGLAAQAPEAEEVPGLPDAEIVSPSRAGQVTFPHALHAEEMGFECSECHHETAAAGLGTPHGGYLEECRNDCEACHREGTVAAAPQSCSACHHDELSLVATEALSAKVAIHTSCWNCHESGTGEEATRGCGFCHAGERSTGQEGS